MELTDEEQRHRTRIAFANDPRLHGPREVFRYQTQRLPRRRFLGRGIERDDQRGLPRAQVHLHRDGRADHGLQKRHDLLRKCAQDHARILRTAADELLERLRKPHLPRAHRRREELLLGREVAKDRCRRHSERRGDVGEGR
jgi:hypothetical protein